MYASPVSFVTSLEYGIVVEDDELVPKMMSWSGLDDEFRDKFEIGSPVW